MIEKLIVLEDIDPVIFYGVNNANIQLIKALYPKLRIVARGNVIKVLGDEEEMCAFEENITKLEKYCAEYNSLKEEVIIDIIKGNAPQAEKAGNVIVFSVTGKPIIPRSENQLKLVEGFAKNDMVFAIGPAGGFIFGFIPMAMLCGAGIKKGFPGKPFVLGIAGLAVCHAFGVVQFSIVTGNTIPASFLAVSVPYIVKDVISVVVAVILGVAVRKALSAAHVMNYGTAA